MEEEAVTHLAGHIKVSGGDEWIEALDREGCYCPVFGCMENTCSATPLQKMAGQMVNPGIENIQLFQMASRGEEKAQASLAGSWKIKEKSAYIIKISLFFFHKDF